MDNPSTLKKDQPQRQNLNENCNIQSFSINQSPDASENWYEQLQFIPFPS